MYFNSIKYERFYLKVNLFFLKFFFDLVKCSKIKSNYKKYYKKIKIIRKVDKRRNKYMFFKGYIYIYIFIYMYIGRYK